MKRLIVVLAMLSMSCSNKAQHALILEPNPLCARVCRAYVSQDASWEAYVERASGTCFCKINPDP